MYRNCTLTRRRPSSSLYFFLCAAFSIKTLACLCVWRCVVRAEIENQAWGKWKAISNEFTIYDSELGRESRRAEKIKTN